MKPRSIIFLIISAFLIISGVILCLVGVGMAKSADQELFTSISDDKTYYKQDFSGGEISKIEFLVKDAEINVFGNSSSSYIEYINYNPNLYSITTTSRIISFDEIPDFSSMIKFWENGFGFKGLRHVFNRKNFSASGKDKIINLYIGTGSGLSNINIEGDETRVNIKDAYLKEGCKIEIKSGNINAEGLITDSYITIKTNSADVEALKTSTKNFSVTSSESNINVSACAFDNIDVGLKSGSVNIENKEISNSTSYILSSDSGNILLNGEDKGNIFMNAVPNIESEIKIKTESANIIYQVKN